MFINHIRLAIYLSSIRLSGIFNGVTEFVISWKNNKNVNDSSSIHGRILILHPKSTLFFYHAVT